MGNVTSSRISKDLVLTSENDFDDSIVKEYNQNVTSYFLDTLRKYVKENGNKEFLVNCGARYWSKETLSKGPEVVTLRDFLEKVPAFANSLYKRGLRPGDVVHIIIGTRADIYIPVHATLYCQGVVSISVDSISRETLQSEVSETEAKFVICTNDTLEKVSGVSATIINLDTELHDMLQEGFQLSSSLVPQQTHFNDQDLAVILWTSGTTGKPKGIQLNIVSLWRGLFLAPKEEGNTLITCNFGHVSGFSYSCFWSIHFAVCTQHFISPEDVSVLGVEKILHTMKETAFSVVMMAASHVVYIAEKSNNGELQHYPNYDVVKYICPAGAHTYPTVDDDLRKTFHKLENVPNFYAMTETGGLLLYSANQRSCGGVMGDMEVYVRDPQSGKRLGPNQSGEMVFRNPHKPTLGYLKRPEETKKFFLEDGWCCTGDIFHYSDCGEFFYEGRMKDMFKSQGNHVYPIELEHIIQSFSKDIIEAGIFSVAKGIHVIMGAIVVTNPTACIDPESIRSFLNDQVDEYKQLKGRVLLTTEPLPRNANGKLLRNEIESRAQKLLNAFY